MFTLQPSRGRSCCIEGGSLGCLHSPSELLRNSPWNLAKLCDLPLNPERLGHWPSHSWPCPVQPVLASFHSITFPV